MCFLCNMKLIKTKIMTALMPSLDTNSSLHAYRWLVYILYCSLSLECCIIEGSLGKTEIDFNARFSLMELVTLVIYLEPREEKLPADSNVYFSSNYSRQFWSFYLSLRTNCQPVISVHWIIIPENNTSTICISLLFLCYYSTTMCNCLTTTLEWVIS